MAPIKVKAVRFDLTNRSIAEYWIEKDPSSGKIHLFLVPQDPDDITTLQAIFQETQDKLKIKKVELPDFDSDSEYSDSDESDSDDSDSDDE